MSQLALAEFIAAAQAGKLVSFPTDTVPAMAVRPDCSEIIFEAKRRRREKPLILMGGAAEQLWPYVSGTPDEFQIWQEVVDQYWPGALTLVLPASDRLPVEMNPLDPTTIGIRVPDSPIACHILLQTGPMATTSINRSGKPPLRTIAAINQQFPEIITLTPEALQDLADALDTVSPEDSAATSGVPSTVARWTGEGWKILREGGIHLEG
jgi:L-threonylcarbamoyladenylate synthase